LVRISRFRCSVPVPNIVGFLNNYLITLSFYWWSKVLPPDSEYLHSNLLESTFASFGELHEVP
jgi:hypothetical protein